MKTKYIALTITLCFTIIAKSQTFSDNFDNYTAGTFITANSSSWKTWSGTSSGADDLRVSNAKAKSGSNSLFFSSTTSPGGPADIVLPFGGQYNTGNFSFSYWIFVDLGKKAYINLQEQSTLGKGWSVDIHFDSVGNVKMLNTLSGNLLNTTYTQGEWTKVDMKINLSTNTWEVLINDVSKGVFQNMYRQIASVNFYPTVGSSYYIDDVSYNYTPHIKSTLDAAVSYIDNVQGYLAGMSVIPAVEIRNLGNQTITSASVEFSYRGNTQTKSISGVSIASLAIQNILMDNPVLLAAGSNPVTATIKLINNTNDDSSSNNTKIVIINPVVPAVNKLVIAEEGTGTWCQWCPRGAVWLNKMDAKYPGLIQGIAVHNGDIMTDHNYNKGLGTIISGYPSLVVDRGADIDPSGMEPDFLARIVIAPKTVIKNGAQFNSTTGELKVSLTTKFLQSASGNYKIACVLIEDSVTGTGSEYNQSNAYANNANGVMGGYELLPNPVPASMMVYEHVARVISPNFGGLSNSFSAIVNAGDSFTHNFTFEVNWAWRASKIKIVGMVIEPNGKIDNATSTKIINAVNNGYINGTYVTAVQNLFVPENAVMVYPNPSNNIFNLILNDELKSAFELQIFNVQGQLIYTSAIENKNKIAIDAQGWKSGIYIANIKYADGVYKMKLVKE